LKLFWPAHRGKDMKDMEMELELGLSKVCTTSGAIKVQIFEVSGRRRP